jgi:hypothetical protein
VIELKTAATVRRSWWRAVAVRRSQVSAMMAPRGAAGAGCQPLADVVAAAGGPTRRIAGISVDEPNCRFPYSPAALRD